MHFEAGTMFAQLFAFLVLFLVLRRFAFKPLAQAIQDRQDFIEEQIKNAETQRLEAEQLQAKHKEEMIKAREEALEIVENARKRSEKQAEEIMEAAKMENERLKENAKAEIIREKDQAMAELRDQIGAMSVQIAAKIIEKDVNETDHKQIIDKYIQAVGESV